MVFINLKIKTLESGDNLVSIDDESSLSDFRAVVQEVTSIEKDSQRLIFRGRALVDNARTLKSYGMENEMAVHVVKRVPSAPRADGPPLRADGDVAGGAFDGHHHHHAHFNSHNVIVGSLPFERTAIFDNAEGTLALIRSVLEGLHNNYQFVSDVHMPANNDGGGGEIRPLNAGDFTISVMMRGLRETSVDSPARERFESLRMDLRKLAWMVTTVKILFNKLVDSLFEDNFGEPSQTDANSALAGILQGMQDLDSLAIDALRALHDEATNDWLMTLADEIDAWSLPEDEAHQERMDNDILMRHIISADMALLLEKFHKIDKEITDNLIARYMRVLRMPQNHEVASFTARLLNCFTSAVSRIQHLRAHVYHSISDFSVHVDANPHTRVYPQYNIYEREEPPEANIVFSFLRPATPSANNNSNASDVASASASGTRPATGTTTENTTTNPPASTGDRVLSSIQQFLQQQQNRSSASHQNQNLSAAPPPTNQNDGRSTGASGQVLGSTVDMQGLRTPAASMRFNQTSSGSSSGTGGGTPLPRFPGSGFRMAYPVGGLAGMHFPVGAGFAVHNPTAGEAHRFMAGMTPMPPHPAEHLRQPPSHQGEASAGIDSEPMDTTTNATPSTHGSHPLRSNSGQGQGQARFGGSLPLPQSLNLGQALSEFMTLASQFSGGAIPLRSSAGQSSQTNRNRLNPSFSQQGGSAMRRSSSTSRLAGANSSDNATQTPGPIPQPPPPMPIPVHRAGARPGPPHTTGSNLYDGAAASLLGWRQWPANSPYALFVGQRPPHAIPLFTDDPNLPCASRRLREFALDARHGDFWNDPITVASGIRLRAASNDQSSTTTENRDTHESPSPSAATGQHSGGNATSDGDRSRQNAIDIQVNRNGEAIFTEERVFRDYVQRTFEQVAISLNDFQSSTPSGRQRQFRRLRRQSDLPNQVFGYSPMIGHPFGLSRAGGPYSMEGAGPRVFEGIISITAEIPMNVPDPSQTNNNNNGNNNDAEGNGQRHQASASTNRNTANSAPFTNTAASSRNSGRGGGGSGVGSNSASRQTRVNNSDFIDDLEEMD